MLKIKILYMVIIILLAIFIVTHISRFSPQQYLKFTSSVHLLTSKDKHIQNYQLTTEDRLKIDTEVLSPIEGKVKRSNIIVNKGSIRTHNEKVVFKNINEDKTQAVKNVAQPKIVVDPKKVGQPKIVDPPTKGKKQVVKKVVQHKIVDLPNILNKQIESNLSTKHLGKIREQPKSMKETVSTDNFDTADKYTSVAFYTEPPLALCPARGSKLVGPLYVDQNLPKSMQEVEKGISVSYGGSIQNGGWWSPSRCKPRTKVALIIPYRKRPEQLKIFLRHMHPILQRQQLFYRIIVVEQLSNDPFNRAGLFNVGFVESIKISPFDCFVFSDVDLLPEDDRNYYGCPTSPRHMSVAVDQFNYKIPYATIFGGVGSFTRDHFEKINGMSNLFWGWGGEDDDLYARIYAEGLSLTRPSMQIARYKMVKKNHYQSTQADPNRMNLLRNSKARMVVDGLNTLKYHLKEIVEDPLVTFVKIELKKQDYFTQ